MVTCQLCLKEFKSLTPTHLKKAHSVMMAKYRAKFPDAPLRDVSSEQRKRYSRSAKAVWADPEYKAKHAPRLAAQAQDANAALQAKRQANPEFDEAWLEAWQAAQDKNRKPLPHCADCGNEISPGHARCFPCYQAWRLENALHPCENPDCETPVKGRLKYCSPECKISDPAWIESRRQAGRISQEKHPENINNLEPGRHADILTRPDVRRKQRLASSERHKGIPKSSEQRCKMSASHIRHWRSIGVMGTGHDRPPLWNLIRERIRQRDQRCLICGKTKGWQSLDVHHLNGNPQDNRDVNLASLCRSCHMHVTAKGNKWCPWPLPEELP